MTHVIEHLPDPSIELQIIREITKKEGLLIIETPTYDSFMFKMLGSRERSISCDGHVFFFTKKTLKTLVEKNGFEVVHHELVGRTLSLERLMWNIGIISKNKHIKQLTEQVSTYLNLSKVKIHINMRDMQRIYCIKK